MHLAIRPGTNVAVLNGLAQQLIEHDAIDRAFVDGHTVGFETLEQTVAAYTPERVAEICGIRRHGSAPGRRDPRRGGALCSTFVLQGVYQSHQATAAACAVNNLHLLRGMIGRPGAGILQMNGQPTAQNTRETGCDGDLPGFRNWENEAHVDGARQAVERRAAADPALGPADARDADLPVRRAGLDPSFSGSSAPTRPSRCRSFARIRSILSQDELFVVVSDAFLTETARLADVVLPAAIWGEKTGTFTNADRTVHLSEQAVDAARRGASRHGHLPRLRPPARSPRQGRRAARQVVDARGVLRGVEGVHARPAVRLHRPELREAARRQRDPVAVQRRGPRRDRAALRRPPIRHHCRIVCEDYGHDLETGATFSAADFKAHGAEGRAVLKAAEWTPPHEWAGDEYPFALTTGRTVYHFHTRTKTGRAPELQAAAPDVWVELCPSDAEQLGIDEGDLVRVSSPRGSVEAPARLRDIREGVVFVPFHYGYWDWARRGPTAAPEPPTS